MKKYLLLAIVLFLLAQISTYAQKRTSKNALPTQSEATTDRDAAFTASPLSGTAPLEVSFTDESTGEIISWQWVFGDGDSSNIQHPSHIYENPGAYTVSLKVFDGTSYYTLEKGAYIHVEDGDAYCDTLNFPLEGSYTYYIANGDAFGYVSGNNSYGDVAKAEYFPDYPPETEISGMLLDFAVAKASSSDEMISILVWDNNGEANSPGGIIYSEDISLNQIVDDVNAGLLTYIPFDNPPLVEGPFYAGVMLPQNTGDTLALWTNTDGDAPANRGWEQWSDESWHPYSSSWELFISNGIYPILCESSQGTGLYEKLAETIVFPNPGKRFVYIKTPSDIGEQIHLRVFSIFGTLMLEESIHPGKEKIHKLDLEGLGQGLYFILFKSGNVSYSKKISLI